jgi:hypothetical protein
VKYKAERFVLRPWPALFVAAVSSAVAILLPTSILLALVGLNRNPFAWSALGALTFLVFVVSVVRVRCVISSEGVQVVNLWRTHDVPWTTFRRTELAEGWLGAAFFLSLFSPIRIRTTDGRKVIVQASLADDGQVATAIESRRPR